MTKTKSSTQKHAENKAFSDDYNRIKTQAEKNWPSWKVKAYNNFASSRAQKITVSR